MRCYICNEELTDTEETYDEPVCDSCEFIIEDAIEEEPNDAT